MYGRPSQNTYYSTSRPSDTLSNGDMQSFQSTMTAGRSAVSGNSATSVASSAQQYSYYRSQQPQQTNSTSSIVGRGMQGYSSSGAAGANSGFTYQPSAYGSGSNGVSARPRAGSATSSSTYSSNQPKMFEDDDDDTDDDIDDEDDETSSMVGSQRQQPRRSQQTSASRGVVKDKSQELADYKRKKEEAVRRAAELREARKNQSGDSPAPSSSSSASRNAPKQSFANDEDDDDQDEQVVPASRGRLAQQPRLRATGNKIGPSTANNPYDSAIKAFISNTSGQATTGTRTGANKYSLQDESDVQRGGISSSRSTSSASSTSSGNSSSRTSRRLLDMNTIQRSGSSSSQNDDDIETADSIARLTPLQLLHQKIELRGGRIVRVGQPNVPAQVTATSGAVTARLPASNTATYQRKGSAPPTSSATAALRNAARQPHRPTQAYQEDDDDDEDEDDDEDDEEEEEPVRAPPKRMASAPANSGSTAIARKPMAAPARQPQQPIKPDWNNSVDDDADGMFGPAPPVPKKAQPSPARKPEPRQRQAPAPQPARRQRPPPPPPQEDEDEEDEEGQEDEHEDEEMPRGTKSGQQFEGEEYVDDIQLATCNICNRKFAIDRLAKHKSICKTATTKLQKRKTFNMEIVPPEAQKLKKQAEREQPKQKASNQEQPLKKIPKWKAEHQRFQAILKQNKASAAGNTAPVLSREEEEMLDDRTPCPHCGRKFNTTAFERHIGVCKGILAKPKALAKGSGGMSMSTRTAQQQRGGSNDYSPSPTSMDGGFGFGGTTRARQAPAAMP